MPLGESAGHSADSESVPVGLGEPACDTCPLPQLTNKALSSSSQGELERRLRQLTETLIQKQTVLESLSTEKSALAFQLERLERQLSSAGSGGEGSAVIVPGLGLDAGEGNAHAPAGRPCRLKEASPGDAPASSQR